jgi:hypothetical protein
VVAVSHLSPGAAREELWLLVEARRHQPTAPAALAALEGAVRRAVVAATGLRPDRVLLLCAGALPRTSSGKLRRAETRRRLLADGFAGELLVPGAGRSLVRELGSRPAVQAAAALLRSRRLQPRKTPRGRT